MTVARVYPAAVLLVVGLALFAVGAAAGDDPAGKPAIEARVDAIERRFEAGLQQAEERLRSELRNELAHELAQMKGELKRLGGAAGPVQVRHLRFDGEAWRNTAVCMQCRSHTRSNRTITLHAGHCRGMINFHE